MPGLLAYSGAGLGLLALAALEALQPRLRPLPLLPRRLSTPRHHRHLLAALLSALCLLSALLSAHHLALPTLAASALFLLHSLAPFAFARLAAPPPPALLDLLLAAAFGQELLLFAHRRPSTAAGIENRYFDLFLVPVTVCLGATLLAAHRPGAAAPRLARAAGLALQGTWMLQMGFSFFTDAIAAGCYPHGHSTPEPLRRLPKLQHDILALHAEPHGAGHPGTPPSPSSSTSGSAVHHHRFVATSPSPSPLTNPAEPL